MPIFLIVGNECFNTLVDQNQWPNKPETLLIDFNAQKSFDVPIEIKENTRIKDCKDDEDYDLIACIHKDQNKIMEGTKGWYQALLLLR